MGLLTKLKSALGLEREERSAGSGSDVTVEREASTASEEAVKEPTDGSADADEDDEPVASETDAAASTESLVDEEHTDDSTRAAEPAEAVESGGEESTETPTDDESDDVSTVKGIGPAYAERLHEAGIETVADLAAADAESLAAETDLSEKRVGRWIDTAQSQD